MSEVFDWMLAPMDRLALHTLMTMSQAPVNLPGDQDPGNSGPDFGKASPVGLLVIVLLLLGTFGLVWSMNRQLRKVPDSFDRDNPEPDQDADPGSVKDETRDEPPG